jgi:hypothetical protein
VPWIPGPPRKNSQALHQETKEKQGRTCNMGTGIPTKPRFEEKTICTLGLKRKTLEFLPSHQLPSISDNLQLSGFDFEQIMKYLGEGACRKVGL